MKTFCQNVIIISVKERLQVLTKQITLHFVTQSVTRALEYGGSPRTRIKEIVNLKDIFPWQFSLNIGTRNTISSWGNERSFRGQVVSDVFFMSYFSFYAIW